MQRITRDQAQEFAFAVKEPVITVDPGELFVLETTDASNARIRTPEDHFHARTLGDSLINGMINPAAGPVAIRGAEPGDTLVVTIHDIVSADQGFVATEGGMGPLLGTAYPELRDHFTEIATLLPGPSGTTSDGSARLADGTTWPLTPMIGSMGLAPARPEIGNATLTMQSRFGGNLDCGEIGIGARIYYPVGQAGGLLYAGDVQASQGTEFAGTALETSAEVTLSAEIIKAKSVPFVRVENDDYLIQLASQRPWEDAIRQAYLWLLDWLVEDHGLTARQAVTHFNGNSQVQARVYCASLSAVMSGSVGVQFPKSQLGTFLDV